MNKLASMGFISAFSHPLCALPSTLHGPIVIQLNKPCSLDWLKNWEAPVNFYVLKPYSTLYL